MPHHTREYCVVAPSLTAVITAPPVVADAAATVRRGVHCAAPTRSWAAQWRNQQSRQLPGRLFASPALSCAAAGKSSARSTCISSTQTATSRSRSCSTAVAAASLRSQGLSESPSSTHQHAPAEEPLARKSRRRTSRSPTNGDAFSSGVGGGGDATDVRSRPAQQQPQQQQQLQHDEASVLRRAEARVERLNAWCASYYAGTPDVSDAAYDAELDALRADLNLLKSQQGEVTADAAAVAELEACSPLQRVVSPPQRSTQFTCC